MSNKYFTSTIGIEQYLKEVNELLTQPKTSNYPPYNLIAIGDSNYRVEVAVAGFAKEDLKIETALGYLEISGTVPETSDPTSVSELASTQSIHYDHRGLSKRNFKLSWKLAQYLEVDTVSLKDGLLTVDLALVLPDTLKPTTFNIK